jgi:hypothetical protein
MTTVDRFTTTIPTNVPPVGAVVAVAARAFASAAAPAGGTPPGLLGATTRPPASAHPRGVTAGAAHGAGALARTIARTVATRASTLDGAYTSAVAAGPVRHETAAIAVPRGAKAVPPRTGTAGARRAGAPRNSATTRPRAALRVATQGPTGGRLAPPRPHGTGPGPATSTAARPRTRGVVPVMATHPRDRAGAAGAPAAASRPRHRRHRRGIAFLLARVVARLRPAGGTAVAMAGLSLSPTVVVHQGQESLRVYGAHVLAQPGGPV